MDKQGFCEAGYAHEQAMASAKKSVKRCGDDFLLTYNDLADFLLKRAYARSELIQDCNRITFNDGRRG